ncbi:MAG: hypothetical protein ACREQD_12095 [Candidatus Binataceae bacterium]
MLTKTRKHLLRGLIAATVWMPIAAGVAHAHGGMAGPDEMGPPMGTSIAIGLACYYLITLWPARRHDDSERKSSARSARRPR